MVSAKVSIHNLHSLFRNFIEAPEPLEIRLRHEQAASFVVRRTDGLFTIYLRHVGAEPAE